MCVFMCGQEVGGRLVFENNIDLICCMGGGVSDKMKGFMSSWACRVVNCSYLLSTDNILSAVT